MSECVEPVRPDPTASPSEWLEYYRLLDEYQECLIEEAGGQPYSGICDLNASIARTGLEIRAKLTMVTTPPPPLPLTPAGTLSGLASQMVAVSADAAAQDLSDLAGQQKAYQDLTWMQNWLTPASTPGTMAQLAGC